MNSPVLQTIKIRRLSLLRSHYLGSCRYRNLTTYYESMTIKRRHICDTLSLTESPKLVISVTYELVGQGSPDQYNRPYDMAHIVTMWRTETKVFYFSVILVLSDVGDFIPSSKNVNNQMLVSDGPSSKPPTCHQHSTPTSTIYFLSTFDG